MKMQLIAGLVLLAAAVRGGEYHRPDIQYVDGALSFDNPARGPAGGGWTEFKPEGLPKWRGRAGFHSSLWELSRFSGGREEKGKRPAPERVGGKDLPISEAMKADVRRFLAETREANGTLIVRLGYTWSDQAGCEPSDFECLLGHVRDLSRIMADFDDVIVGVEAGLAGPWGEMHSSEYCRPEYMNRILGAYCDNLPESISILVRAPAYICHLAGTNTVGTLDMLPFSDRRLRRLGMYNDGYLGTWWDYGTWAGDFTRERGCQMLRTFGDHPYGGEMAYINRDWLAKNMKLFEREHWNIVEEWYATHLSYLRNLAEKGHTLAEFLANDLKFDSKVYAFEGMPRLDEYDGQSMNKFVRDHMGYRFVVRDARLPRRVARGKATRLALEIENTGFGKMLLPTRTSVIFVPRSEADGGVKHARRAAAACDLSMPGGMKRRVAVDFVAPVDLAPGECDLFLGVCAPFKDERPDATVARRPVRFANDGLWDDALRAHRLGRVEVVR